MNDTMLKLAMALRSVRGNEKIVTILKNTNPALLKQIKDALAAFSADSEAYQARMQAAFELVCDPFDWKAPIRKAVPADTNLELLCQAVEHFTATTPTFTPVYGLGVLSYILVEADGYRKGPAGDK